MTSWLDALALATSAAGVLAVLVASGFTGSWRAGFDMALTLWVAAGLLRLAELPSWSRIAGAAATLVVRQIVSRSLRARKRRMVTGR